MPIRQLAPDLVRRIAAGEVIERPASVVKELVENSLDAGARQISVQLEAGGVKLLRVADDGAGIPADDLDLAVARHATSKLADLEDLTRIESLGFRGEALASIAAVSDLTLISRPADQAAAAYLIVRDGAIVDRGKRAQTPGTTVTVRHLFRHLPGRLKFLRSQRAEAGAVQTVLTRYALAYPDVRFSLSVDGRTVLLTAGAGDLRETAARLLQVSDSRLCRIERDLSAAALLAGVVGLPEASRPNRSGLLLCINRRPVENVALRYAIEEAYRGYLGQGRHPIAILHLSVPPGELDVNVHPTKAEVRLVAERATAAALYQAVREALAESAPIPAWVAAPAAIDAAGQQEEAGPAVEAEAEPAGPVEATVAQPTFLDLPSPADSAPGGRLPPLRVLGQAGLTYVTAEGPDGIYLIDQHAAHERINYERLRAQYADRAIDQQGLLGPEPIDLGADLLAGLADDRDRLSAIGFSVEPFGEAQALVRAVPGLLAGRDPAASLREILMLRDSHLDELAWLDRALTTIACHGSVRAGQTLSLDEMRALIRQLEESPNPRTCPHGRPTIVHLSATQLERQFGRR